MIVEAQISIDGSKEAVWSVITDIENGAAFISGIEKIEIADKPESGLVGLTWRETRMYFGNLATVEKRITEGVENEFYKTRAEDSGFVFETTMKIEESGSGVVLTSSHDSQPQGFVAKLKSAPMFLFKGVVRKALLQDLNDIKAAVNEVS
jgi:carbon monoxide dehydrogenase subunit G